MCVDKRLYGDYKWHKVMIIEKTAAKEHRCNECTYPISKGEKYLTETIYIKGYYCTMVEDYIKGCLSTYRSHANPNVCKSNIKKITDEFYGNDS
jgi:hypothetical protein